MIVINDLELQQSIEGGNACNIVSAAAIRFHFLSTIYEITTEKILLCHKIGDKLAVFFFKI